jgi:hypothetical protein
MKSIGKLPKQNGILTNAGFSGFRLIPVLAWIHPEIVLE